MWVKTGVNKNGAITGMHFKSLLDGGGYGSYGVAARTTSGELQTVTYHVPRYRFQGARVSTNKPPCGPKRGHGTPSREFALEVHLRQGSPSSSAWIRPRSVSNIWFLPTRSRQLAAHRLDGARVLHRQGDRRLGVERAVQAAPLRQGDRTRVLVVHHRRGNCRSTGTRCPTRAAAQVRSRRGGHRVLRLDRDSRQGSDSILATIVAEVLGLHPLDVAVVTGEHRSDAGGLGQLLEPGHAHDGQRGHPGGRARPRRHCPPRGKSSRRDRARRLRRGRVFDVQDRARAHVRRRRCSSRRRRRGRSARWAPTRLLRPPAGTRRGSGALTRLLLQRLCRGGRRGSRDRDRRVPKIWSASPRAHDTRPSIWPNHGAVLIARPTSWSDPDLRHADDPGRGIHVYLRDTGAVGVGGEGPTPAPRYLPADGAGV